MARAEGAPGAGSSAAAVDESSPFGPSCTIFDPHKHYPLTPPGPRCLESLRQDDHGTLFVCVCRSRAQNCSLRVDDAAVETFASRTWGALACRNSWNLGAHPRRIRAGNAAHLNQHLRSFGGFFEWRCLPECSPAGSLLFRARVTLLFGIWGRRAVILASSLLHCRARCRRSQTLPRLPLQRLPEICKTANGG